MMDKDKGFTLVELLVVISVIALLMGILMPALGKVRNVAKRTVCQSNLRQIGVAFRAYLDDNSDVMPPACEYPTLISDPNDLGYRPPITKFLLPLLKEKQVFKCPADVKDYYKNWGLSYEYYARMFSGRPLSTTRFAQDGIKERNMHVMSDFDAVPPRTSQQQEQGFRGRSYSKGEKNYLYADWHVGNPKNQD